MKNYKEARNARTSKKKGMRYSIGFHTILVALLLFPFITNVKKETPKYEEIVVVDFSSASSLKGASGSMASSPAKEQPKQRKVDAVEQIKSIPPPDVLTQEESTLEIPEVDIKNPPERLPEEYRKAPAQLETDGSADKVETESSPIDLPTIDPIPMPESGSGGNGTGSSNSDGVSSNSGSGSGNADSGSGKSDTGAGEDNGGDGLFGDNIGELSRSVIYRPDVSAMIQENSTIRIRLCISRAGRVVNYAYEPEGSHVSDPSLIKTTLRIVSQYRFEELYFGPKLECGIYTIKVDMSNIDNSKL